MRALVSLVLFTSMVPTLVAGQQADTVRLKRLYMTAVEAAGRQDISLAITLMDSVIQTDSTLLDAWWNLGLWHASLGQSESALRDWKSYHALDSTDWRVESKLVQAYQALNDIPRRDSALAGLLHHRSVTRNPDLLRAEVFCREQALVNGQRVMVMQTFAPKGDRMVFYTFYLLSPEGREVGRYSLGSYDLTTNVAREAGEIGKKDRLYHIDYYAPQAHSAVAFYRTMPTYDEARAVIWESLRTRPPQ